MGRIRIVFVGFALLASLLGASVAGAEPVAEPAEAPSFSRGVLFVVDVSGSMRGTRLTQAKGALHTGVDALQPARGAGLRPYSGSCSSGGTLRVPLGIDNRDELRNEIDALIAGGGTPTPAALQAAAGDFPGGLDERVVILISDGQSTCGDPCPVAAQIAADSDISFIAHTVGFNAPDSAESELSCIAEVTGGTYISATDEEGLADAISGALGGANNPILFVPGITGSTMIDSDTEDELWPKGLARRNHDRHLRQLMFATDGDSPHPMYGVDAEAEDIFRSYLRQNVYSNMVDMLEDAGYVEGANLETLPLDWRRSAETNAPEVIDAARQLRQRTGADRVDIIAHSQGGLVTAAALNSPALDNTGLVGRVATLGTPFLGSVKALGILEYAEPCFLPLGPWCVLHKGRAHQVTQNWPGFLELLPAPEYDHGVAHAIYTRNEELLDWQQVRDQLYDSGRNRRLLHDARWVQARNVTWDPADSSVELMRVAGTGLDTAVQIHEITVEECSGMLWWRDCEDVDDVAFARSSGDATVPLASAAMTDRDEFDLRGHALTAYASGVNHTDLADNQAILDLVIEFFDGAHSTASGAAAAQTEMFAALSSTTDEDVLLDVPEGLAGLELTMVGATAAELTDHAGAKVATSDLEDRDGSENDPIPPGLPGASADATAHTSTLFATRDGAYTAHWNIQDDGQIHLRLRTYDDDEIIVAHPYPQTPVAAGDTVTATFTTPLDAAPILEIDETGDGVADRTVEPRPAVVGDAAADTSAPRIDIVLERHGHPSLEGSEVTVTVSADDPGGSGIDRVEYGLLPDMEESLYEQPLRLPARGELVVRATDRAGNAARKVVTLGDRPARPELVEEFTTPHFNESARLQYAGDEDWWGLEIMQPGMYDIQLMGSPEPYDLALHTADGEALADAAANGTRSIQLRERLDPGRYLVRVHSTQNAYDPGSSYRLRATKVGRGGS